ncbi:2-(hydroxymethyl)glutarate dehydrogenase [Methylobacterium crusticola]|uniref:2-(Hydroxymethyl)glutarate dehydrogenase n=1 Tax=Methylobacterium crusticola TaxID=1697972 RepID=A0ABQ4QQH2_9HYPH|nr:NAD(P)-binding domain-containing protein [Methylobacterium crusticola]GJD47532.1 2-(hydroxymethyl)glutarate dehydrogenase [Methylobacterium crusticola]
MPETDSTPLAPPARLGLIGLGKMGLPMGRRLVASGFAVRGFDPLEEARAAFAEAGGTACGSAAEAAAGAEAVVTMLPNGEVVRRAVLEGADAVAGAMRPGAILIEMSSSAPLSTRALGERLAALGIGLVDAPVSGGVRKAEAGTLSIMLGGAGPALARIRPVLEAMGSALFETGPLGSAHAMKALNNYVSAAGLIAACEAVQVGAAFGLDPVVMTDILNVSTGRNNATENKLKPFVLPETYDSGFGLALMTKDVGIAVELAEALGHPAPFSHAVAAFARSALARLGPEADHTAVDRYLKLLAAPSLNAGSGEPG